jgi:hypothetical protein
MPEDELDRLLDSALATYADPGPDTGLEGRVLASLATAQERHTRRGFFVRTRTWLPWTMALPVATSLLVWIGMNRTPPAPLRSSEQPQETAKNVPKTTTQPDAGEKKHPAWAQPHPAGEKRSARLNPCAVKVNDDGPCRPEKREAAKIAPLPKLDIFPTPRPLTTEERVLVTVARDGSKAEREALVAPLARSNAPLDISALNVPPLAASGDGNN